MSKKSKSWGGYTREEYRERFHLEFMRKAILAELERGVPRDKEGKLLFRSEDEAILWSMWKLINPFEIKERRETEAVWKTRAQPGDGDLPPVPPRLRTVTAHSHPGEPLEPSPDDLVIYHRLDLERGAGIHLITDGFDLKIIR